MHQKTIKEVLVFPNGVITVCNELGQQIPELQISVAALWAAFADRRGYDPEGACFNTGVLHRSREGWEVITPAEYFAIRAKLREEREEKERQR
jgi:hypothetical protein